MTQPDGYTPSGALSSTGLATYATKDQADWELEQKTLVSGRFSGAQTGFGNLVAKIPIIGDAVEIFTGIEDGNRNDLGSAVNLFKQTVGNAWNGLFGAIKGTWNAFWNGIFGTSNTGKNPNDVQTAAAAVAATANNASATASTASTNASTSLTKHTNLLTSLRGGYTVDVVNSTSTWNKPTGLSEIYVALFGGGAKGATGSAAGNPGASGGQPGDVIATQLDPKDVPSTVSCTIGGNTSTTPTTTSFGTLVTTDDAFKSYVATPLGVILTGAAPGAGGTGGATNNAGASGATTTVGVTGGSAGASGGGTGGAGNNGLVFAGQLCQTGGSGGGGGGGGKLTGSQNGGAGGAGGFPGGGGGAGGTPYSSSNTKGAGGNGGLGLILVIYKTANNT